MQCRGCEPNLQSSLHGSARPSGSPSRHHQAMTPGSFPIKALAQGLAPDERGHMKGRTPPQVPWESRQPRPVSRKASFLTSHPNPSSNFPQFPSNIPSAAIPVASPSSLRTPRAQERSIQGLRSLPPEFTYFPPLSGIPITLPPASSAFFLKELFWSFTPSSSSNCPLKLPGTLAGSHFSYHPTPSPPETQVFTLLDRGL